MRGYILIADDYADNRELLRLMLERAGYTVREACDGAECVEMARARSAGHRADRYFDACRRRLERAQTVARG